MLKKVIIFDKALIFNTNPSSSLCSKLNSQQFCSKRIHLLIKFITVYYLKSTMISCSVICLVLSFYFLPFVHSSENHSTDSLNAVLQDSALQVLNQHPPPRTGDLYKALLPANLSGMEVSAVRLRSKRLWNIGANFSNFQIPPKTKTKPHVKRLVIVYEDLGNWSSQYYRVPGYSILASVVGFKVFDASDENGWSINKVGLDTMGNPIVIGFPNCEIPESMISEAQCVKFNGNGEFHLSKVEGDRDKFNVCYSKNQGHFSIVIPEQRKTGDQKKQRKKWYLWMVGFVVGLGGIGLLGYFGIVCLKVLMSKKIQVMEKQADEDPILKTLWLGNSKMPSATVTRTQPSIEDGGLV